MPRCRDAGLDHVILANVVASSQLVRLWHASRVCLCTTGVFREPAPAGAPRGERRSRLRKSLLARPPASRYQYTRPSRRLPMPRPSTTHWLRRPAAFAIAIVLSCGLAAPASAIDPDKAFHHYVRNNWSIEQGLSQISALSLAQDRQGYLWIGTHAGLARFDGIRF